MSERVTLIDDRKILSNDIEVAECLNTYFTKITNSLDIEPNFKVISEQLQPEQMVMSAIEKSKNQKSKIVEVFLLPN